MEYRKLSEVEIFQLQSQGCTAQSWTTIEVAENFSAQFIKNVSFSGQIKLGVFDNSFALAGGYSVHSGIYSAVLHNVTVGDNCYINKIHNYIANYDIGANVFIENTNLIVVDTETTFGNGVRVAVLNEAGGREIPIYNKLSAQLAYMIVLYQHNQALISRLEKMIGDYVDTLSATRGVIADNVRIMNVGSIEDVYIGENAIISGASKLKNGSVNSNKYAPVYIGAGVKCYDFILSSGCEITDSTLLSRCFVGQGSQIGKHYSAIDSLFFANCQAFHGEATAIFAGPYTVTHHKSTLLIAGMFSFFNAGSGSNQSNHMYKLGAVHQGILERGCKTASNSYLLMPVRVGAYSVVMGSHKSHPDTANLPFSYLIENQGESYIVPAVNVSTVGTTRDAHKWKKRDNRLDPNKSDKINFKLFSPYIVQKIEEGRNLLMQLAQNSDSQESEVIYNNCKIRKNSLEKGCRLYSLVVDKFVGDVFINRISNKNISNEEALISTLEPTTVSGSGKWVDIFGLFVPQSEIELLISELELGQLTIDEVDYRFELLHSMYDEYEWTWVYDALFMYGYFGDDITVEGAIGIIEKWCNAAVALDEMLYEDVKKDFDGAVQVGYGIDGDDEVKIADFESVRGTLQNNDFAKQCNNNTFVHSELAQDIIEKLQAIKGSF